MSGRNDEQIVREALRYSDLDNACAHIQDRIGQNDGGLAGIFFSRLDLETGEWDDLDTQARRTLLSEYLELERSHQRKEDCEGRVL